MKKIVLILFCLPLFGYTQVNPGFCEKVNSTLSAINKEHFKPKPLNDSLSVYVFTTFFETVDEDKSLFMKSEIESLSKYKLTLDNVISEQNCSFFDDFFQLYKKGLVRKKNFIDIIEKEKNSLNSKDTIFFTKAKLEPLKDEEKLKKLLRKRITFDILETIASKSKNKDSILTHFKSLSKETEKLTFERYKCEINLLLSDDSAIIKSLESTFLNIICSYFDPHTAYFSLDKKDDYISNLRTSNETFGIVFDNADSDNLFIAELIPGSVAFLTDKIEIGDQLIKIKTSQEEFPIQCNYFSKIDDLFSDSSKKMADFTFRKKSGEIYTLKLEKKTLKNIENEVFSSVVTKNNKSFGYISLPSFYTDELNENTVSKDVAKAVINLKNENVEGLIIDLQNNGGGSIGEAINLVGMFIDIGPVSVLVDNEGKKTILKDVNRGMVFNKPIIVIVNGFSASASEFFANAIQDYKRGIVIGSKSYGKGTAQQLVPLEFTDKSTGFVKITKDKFYRINGKSHQKTGVEPDVYLPNLMENVISKESKAINALDADNLDYPIRYEAMKNDFSSAIQNSTNRVNNLDYFQTVKSINSQIDHYVNGDKKPVKLTFDDVYKNSHITDTIYEEIKQLIQTTFDFEIKNSLAIDEKIKHDEYLQKFNELNKKQLQSNAYAFEAIQLLLELSN